MCMESPPYVTLQGERHRRMSILECDPCTVGSRAAGPQRADVFCQEVFGWPARPCHLRYTRSRPAGHNLPIRSAETNLLPWDQSFRSQGDFSEVSALRTTCYYACFFVLNSFLTCIVRRLRVVPGLVEYVWRCQMEIGRVVPPPKKAA